MGSDASGKPVPWTKAVTDAPLIAEYSDMLRKAIETEHVPRMSSSDTDRRECQDHRWTGRSDAADREAGGIKVAQNIPEAGFERILLEVPTAYALELCVGDVHVIPRVFLL
jgi:hypothetical protein